MRKTIIALAAAAAAFCSDANAQITIAYGMDTPSFVLAHEDTDKYETLDTCYLTVSYRFSRRASERDDSLAYEDIMDLQAGRLYNAFFSRNLRELDTRNTESLKKSLRFDFVPAEYAGFDILTSHADSLSTVTNRIPFTSQVIEYTERASAPEWEYLPEETDTVMGYPCHAAVCEFGGRRWKVYYADGIPLPYGPWKLNGTRGLVLKAADDGNNFVFEAAGLTRKPQPVVRYSWNRKRMGKDEWKAFEREMYKNAGNFVRSTGARVLISDNSERGFHPLNEDWTEFYNPLEK